MKIAVLDTTRPDLHWNYNDPENMQLIQSGVEAFCSKRGSNYLELLSVGDACPGDAMVRAMIVSATRSKSKVPLRQLKYRDANTNMDG